MLKLTVLETEYFDEAKQEFAMQGGSVIELEHSLASLSLWESKWEEPFLSERNKSHEEIVDYIRCMCLDPNIPPEVFSNLSQAHFDKVNEYINAKMTATFFNDSPHAPKSKETITAELIYYWMTVFQIPFECETWHLNKLFTLIKICNMKSAKPKKMSSRELAARNRELNNKRRAEMGTTG
jgi:hypothetical protein